MEANVINFSTRVCESQSYFGADPEPYRPTQAVRRFLKDHKSSAPLRARIPFELAEYLQRLADVSDKSFSAIVCRLLLERVLAPRERCPHCGRELTEGLGRMA